jgi:hypothetical protein
MNSCERCNGLTFLKLLMLNLHENINFKNAVFLHDVIITAFQSQFSFDFYSLYITKNANAL